MAALAMQSAALETLIARMSRARIIDADTLHLGDAGPVRLAGLDAPELGQPATNANGQRIDAGQWAAAQLNAFLKRRMAAGWRVRVQGDSRDKYNRTLGRLRLEHPDGRCQDVGAWMVRQGLAVAEYGTQYADDEHAARNAKAGLWGFREIQRPKAYRRADKPRRRRSAGSGGATLASTLRTLTRVLRTLARTLR